MICNTFLNMFDERYGPCHGVEFVGGFFFIQHHDLILSCVFHQVVLSLDGVIVQNGLNLPQFATHVLALQGVIQHGIE
jgi:hypothetical protein